jgi:hypothetical protein
MRRAWASFSSFSLIHDVGTLRLRCFLGGSGVLGSKLGGEMLAELGVGAGVGAGAGAALVVELGAGAALVADGVGAPSGAAVAKLERGL